MPGRISQVTSTISYQWLLWCCDLPVICVLLQMGCLKPLISSGLWENQLHKAERLCPGQGWKEESQRREQLTWEVTLWHCLFLAKDLMCGRQLYLGPRGWAEGWRLPDGCWNSLCPEPREFVTATAFKMPLVTRIHLLPLLGLQFLAHAEADNKPVGSVCSINQHHWTKLFGTGIFLR